MKFSHKIHAIILCLGMYLIATPAAFAALDEEIENPNSLSWKLSALSILHVIPATAYLWQFKEIEKSLVQKTNETEIPYMGLQKSVEGLDLSSSIFCSIASIRIFEKIPNLHLTTKEVIQVLSMLSGVCAFALGSMASISLRLYHDKISDTLMDPLDAAMKTGFLALLTNGLFTFPILYYAVNAALNL